MRAVIKHTEARSEAEAVRLAVKESNRRCKLAAVPDRFKGALPNLMTLEDLKSMREDAKWEWAK